MTYRLNPELRKIQSPVVLKIGGAELEYPNGTALLDLTFAARYSVRSIAARGGTIIIDLQELPGAPDCAEPFEQASFF